MQINHETGVIYDAIAYASNYFNMEKVRVNHKVYMKNEEDIFANYYEFKKKLGFVPSDNLYFFFIFNTTWPNVMFTYLKKCFPDYDFTSQKAIKEIKNIRKFREYAYYNLLEHYKKQVDIKAVINGDPAQAALAVALLSVDHSKYAKQAHQIFFGFDDLVDELVDYFELISNRISQYHEKKGRNNVLAIVREFISCKRVEELRKTMFFNKNENLEKRTFAITFFRRFNVDAPEGIGKRAIIVIGDKSSILTKASLRYNHITKEVASYLFANEAIRDIIKALAENGEKSILQLSFIIPH